MNELGLLKEFHGIDYKSSQLEEFMMDSSIRETMHSDLSTKFNQELYKAAMIAATNAKEMGSVFDWDWLEPPKVPIPPMELVPAFIGPKQ